MFRASDDNSDRSEFSPFETERFRHRAVWRAVISQALIDACSNSRKKYERINKYAAIRWLTKSKRELEEVCLLAGLEYGYVQMKVNKAINSGMLWHDIDECESYLTKKFSQENLIFSNK